MQSLLVGLGKNPLPCCWNSSICLFVCCRAFSQTTYTGTLVKTQLLQWHQEQVLAGSLPSSAPPAPLRPSWDPQPPPPQLGNTD